MARDGRPFNQFSPMPVLYVKGRMRRSFSNTPRPALLEPVDEPRQAVFRLHAARHHIGDCILNYYGEDEGFELISGMPCSIGSATYARTQGYDVHFTFDRRRHTPRTASGPSTVSSSRDRTRAPFSTKSAKAAGRS